MLVLGMTAALAAPVAATGDSATTTATQFSISIANDDTHTYELYQIFTGDVSGTTLTNLKYGSSFGSTTAGTAVSSADMTTLAGINDAGSDEPQDQADIAAMNSFITRASTKLADVDAGHPYTTAVPGYYLLKDVSTTDTSDTATSLILLKVLGTNTQVTAKRDKPNVEKKVDDKNDSNTSEDAEDWHDTADYDIGDMVPFQITATTAGNVDAYKKYHITIVDTQSAGLKDPTEWNLTVLGKEYHIDSNGTVTIKSGNEFVATTDALNTTDNGTKITVSKETVSGATFALKVAFEKATPYTLNPGEEGYDAVAALDLINAEVNSQPIVVTYESELDTDAVMTKEGNKNETYLKYSNNPNETDGHTEGTTPPDIAIVFTFKLDVDKLDQDYAALTGAGFTLLKKFAALPETDPATTATAYPTTEVDDTLRAAASGTFYSVTDSGVTTYWKVIGTQTMTSGSEFRWEGIDDGTYKLIETTVPAGYNKAADVQFTVTATHPTSGDTVQELQLTDLTTDVATFQADKDGGTFTFTKIDDSSKTHAITETDNATVATAIVNQSGTQLPETGGMGTTILYIGGSILVLAAAILLITKRRMNAED